MGLYNDLGSRTIINPKAPSPRVPRGLLARGVAAATAGAAGEYVPVRAPAESEDADPCGGRAGLEADPESERRELTAIYVGRGLDHDLAEQVSAQLMLQDALGAHARDELGISEAQSANPVEAALASAASFAVGAVLPIAVVALAPGHGLIYRVSGMSLVFLGVLGVAAARAGGASVMTSAWRVTFWGALAMAITAGVGALFGGAA